MSGPVPPCCSGSRAMACTGTYRVALFSFLSCTTKSHPPQSNCSPRDVPSRVLSASAPRSRSPASSPQTRWLAPGKRIGIYASMPQELGTATAHRSRARARLRDLPAANHVAARAHHAFLHGSSARGTRPRARHARTRRATTSSSARFLDTIFVPAVALDRRGAPTRDTASGFYDRTLALPLDCARTGADRGSWRSLILSRSCRRFPMTPTDVFMDIIVTDRGIDELLAHEDRAVDVRSR